MNDFLKGIRFLPGNPEKEIRARQQAEREAQEAARVERDLSGGAKSDVQRNREYRARRRKKSFENIAVLDMETDPFDKEKRTSVYPFLAVLYSDNFEPIVIWEEHLPSFIAAVVKAIEDLPDEYTIYAHNGGKFDFLFLISKIRGEVSFKGRGIMSAKIGRHELRDSFHIIPERLASYAKDKFDYANMHKSKRDDWREKIIEYCIADCRYLLDIVKAFVNEFGFKLSIGQAAMAHLKKAHKFECITSSMDAELRKFFFGGRVECLEGRTIETGHWKLYDVNSMYPHVMANFKHPVGKDYITRPGEPGAFTCFLDLECVNHGALVQKNEEDGTTANVREGRFFTTIHEYRTALKYGLIENVKINFVVDCVKQSSFEGFVLPLYARKDEIKKRLDAWPKDQRETPEYMDLKKDYMFVKFLLNNGYGKFAQNPRRYKETYITDPMDRPPEELEGYGVVPAYECGDYWIWERPSPGQRFNNVGTAASITGAARSVLMEAIQLATDPIYCDTDSLMCRDLQGVELHPTKLGAWDLEDEYSEVIICGKKMYSCKPLAGGKDKVRSKGVSGLSHEDMRRIFMEEFKQAVTNFGPTIDKTGRQNYLQRRVKPTAPLLENKRYANRQQMGRLHRNGAGS